MLSHDTDDPQRSRSSAKHLSFPPLHGCDHQLRSTKTDSNRWWRETRNDVLDKAPLSGPFALSINLHSQTEGIKPRSSDPDLGATPGFNPLHTTFRSSDALVKEHPRRLHSAAADLFPLWYQFGKPLLKAQVSTNSRGQYLSITEIFPDDRAFPVYIPHGRNALGWPSFLSNLPVQP